jgi:hypothetical protein
LWIRRLGSLLVQGEQSLKYAARLGTTVISIFERQRLHEAVMAKQIIQNHYNAEHGTDDVLSVSEATEEEIVAFGRIDEIIE